MSFCLCLLAYSVCYRIFQSHGLPGAQQEVRQEVMRTFSPFSPLSPRGPCSPGGPCVVKEGKLTSNKQDQRIPGMP